MRTIWIELATALYAAQMVTALLGGRWSLALIMAGYIIANVGVVVAQ